MQVATNGNEVGKFLFDHLTKLVRCGDGAHGANTVAPTCRYNLPSMGQLALGFRSLIIKLVIFVIMAALLARVLGGTLVPRPHVANLLGGVPAVVGTDQYFWQVTIDARRQEHLDWRLMRLRVNGRMEPADQRSWIDGAGPIAYEDVIYFGGRDPQSGVWRLVRLDKGGVMQEEVLPDRFTIEQELARLQAGATLKDVEAMR